MAVDEGPVSTLMTFERKINESQALLNEDFHKKFN
jgi:hypothetical protein